MLTLFIFLEITGVDRVTTYFGGAIVAVWGAAVVRAEMA